MISTRRKFLTTTAGIAAGATALSVGAPWAWGQATQPTDPPLLDIPELKTPESTKEGDMLFRKLGKTGEKVSLICLGGAHFVRATNATTPDGATKLLRRAVDRGITTLDNCWDYNNGNCEIQMGNALLDGYRKKVFLMTKFDGRTKEIAKQQMDESLTRLKTDMIDVMFIHEIIHENDGERIFAKGGAMEAMHEYKKAGKIRYLGFTGHKSPELFIKFMDIAKKNDVVFDVAMMPINALDAHFRSFVRGIVPRMIKEGTAVVGMKPLAAGALTRLNLITATQCLHYSMTMPVSCVNNGITSEAYLDQALDAVKTFKPFEAKELAELLAKTREEALTGRTETFKTATNFDGTTRNPAWMGGRG